MNTDKLIQALAQHSAYATRASTQAVNELLKLFNAETNAMLDRLLVLMLDLSESERMALMAGKYTTPVLKEIQLLVDEWQSSLGVGIAEKFEEQIDAFAIQEAQYITKLMQASGAGAEIIAGAAVVSVAKAVPVMGGRLIDEMLSNVDEVSRNILLNTTRQGIADGLTTQEIIQLLRGTKATNYIDGLLNAPRQSLERDVRTIRNHVGNVAYEETYKAAGIEWIQFVATLDSRTSKTCASLDGKRYKTSEPHPTPPMHYNCLLGDSLITASEGITGASKRWFNGEVVIIETSSGNKLTCTPNHPILTTSGWVAAGELNKGDDVICHRFGQWGDIGNRNNENMPTTIQEIAGALIMSSSVSTISMPVAAKDFHGDGVGSDIAIIGSNSLLTNGTDPS